jgi:hypothetical protein
MASGLSGRALGLAAILGITGVGLAGLILVRAPAQIEAAHTLSDSVAIGRVAAGRNALAQGERPATVAASARQALDAAPLEASAASLLALSLPQAERAPLMGAAARLSHRDDAADRWLFENGMARGDYAQAMRHADALMRRQTPDERVEVSRRILPYLGQPAAFEAVIGRLATEPSWRGSFMAQLIALGQDSDEPFRVLKALRATSAPPTRTELALYLRPLVAQRRPVEAHRAWVALAASEEQAGKALLADSGFEGIKTTPPFGWNLDASSGGYGEMVASEGAIGKALHVSHDGRSRQWLVRQLVVLPPGAYRLTGQVRTPSDLSAGSMAWTVICEGAREPLTLVPAPVTGDAWKGFSTTFIVPSENCAAQSLVLQGRPGGSGTPVDVWYDSLTLERADVG